MAANSFAASELNPNHHHHTPPLPPPPPPNPNPNVSDDFDPLQFPPLDLDYLSNNDLTLPESLMTDFFNDDLDPSSEARSNLDRLRNLSGIRRKPVFVTSNDSPSSTRRKQVKVKPLTSLRTGKEVNVKEEEEEEEEDSFSTANHCGGRSVRVKAEVSVSGSGGVANGGGFTGGRSSRGEMKVKLKVKQEEVSSLRGGGRCRFGSGKEMKVKDVVSLSVSNGGGGKDLKKKTNEVFSSPYMRRRAEAILNYLSAGCASEVKIRQNIGDTPDTSKALRILLKAEEIKRSGTGGSKDPFLYRVPEFRSDVDSA